MTIKVGIIMGSRSDWETMSHAAEKLEDVVGRFVSNLPIDAARERVAVQRHRAVVARLLNRIRVEGLIDDDLTGDAVVDDVLESGLKGFLAVADPEWRALRGILGLLLAVSLTTAGPSASEPSIDSLVTEVQAALATLEADPGIDESAKLSSREKYERALRQLEKAADYAAEHEIVEGLALWSSYPAGGTDLSGSELEATSI